MQVPFEAAPGAASVVLRKGTCSYNVSLNVAAAAPGLFPQRRYFARAIAVRPDGSFVSPDNRPARRGEVVRVFTGGMGAAAFRNRHQPSGRQRKPTPTCAIRPR